MVFVQLADDIADEDERIYLNLNSTTLSGVALDDSFLLNVTACNDITCRTSKSVALSKYIVNYCKSI